MPTTFSTKLSLPQLARVATLTDEAGTVTQWRVEWNRVRQQYTVHTREASGQQTTSLYNKDGRLLQSTSGGLTTQSSIDSPTKERSIDANEQGTLTKAYGFHPDAQTNGLWSTNPVWQADVAGGKLKDENTQWHYLHTDHLGTPYMATNKQGEKTWRAYPQAIRRSHHRQGINDNSQPALPRAIL